MRHLRTQTTIDAPTGTVWAILTDLPSWAQWNPSFHDMQGEPVVGSRLSFRLGEGSRLRIRPRVVEVVEGSTFAWLGHLGVRGLFDGEHRFTLEPTAGGGTHLVHEERFSGILRRPVLRRVGEQTRAGFEAMNEALKARAEAAAAAAGAA
jgi:hypothetical protein